MPSDKSIPQGHQRPDVATRHARQASNADKSAENSQDNSYERVIIHATAAPFIMFPVAAMLDSELTHRDKCVLMAMCWHANQRHLLWCKQETLAAELNLPISKISESIAQLIAHGYAEIVRKAYRGAENAALRTNKYRIIWQDDKGEPDPDELPATHISRSGKSIFPATGNHISRSGKQNRTLEQNQKEQSPSEDSFNSTSLAHSAEKPAESTTVTMTAPLTRTRERFDSSALRRDPLYIALAEHLPEPQTYDEWRTWAAMIGRLHRIQVSAADIPTAVKGYGLLYPNAVMTIRALVNQWAHIREGKTREQVAATVRNRNTPQTERAAQAERERRDAERAEVDRLMAEWGYGTRQGEPPRR